MSLACGDSSTPTNNNDDRTTDDDGDGMPTDDGDGMPPQARTESVTDENGIRTETSI